jgi:hypothetical protein
MDRQLAEGNPGFRVCGIPIGFPTEGIMKTVTLSESAVALMRFQVKGWPIKFREPDLPAFQELLDAGIMEPNGQDFRFTEEGWLQRKELSGERSLAPRHHDNCMLAQ